MVTEQLSCNVIVQSFILFKRLVLHVDRCFKKPCCV